MTATSREDSELHKTAAFCEKRDAMLAVVDMETAHRIPCPGPPAAFKSRSLPLPCRMLWRSTFGVPPISMHWKYRPVALQKHGLPEPHHAEAFGTPSAISLSVFAAEQDGSTY